MCHKRLHMPEHMVLERSDGGVGECLAEYTPFPRMGYFIDRALRIVGRGRGFEGPVRRGLLHIGSASVDVCSGKNTVSKTYAEERRYVPSSYLGRLCWC